MAEFSVVERVRSLRIDLAAVTASLSPAGLSTSEAGGLLEEFAIIERLAACAKLLLAQRARESNAWRAAGAKSPEAWLAQRTGTGVGQARQLLEASEAVSGLPVVEEAVRSGRLSEVQAIQITGAAKADPAAQSTLVDAAETEDLRALKARCQTTRAAALPDDRARQARIHAERSFRSWLNAEGACCAAIRGTAADGARFLAAFEPFRERCFRAARQAGRRQPFEAVAFDGLMAMAQAATGSSSGEGGGRATPATVSVRVDRSALLRGHTVAGETCEIRGLGAVPVAAAHPLMNDAFLVGLLLEGTEVTSVKRFGRHIPVVVRDALAERDQVCTEPRCGNTLGLQYDHIDPYRHSRNTSYTNLARRCPSCHRAKTEADRERDRANETRGPDPPCPP